MQRIFIKSLLTDLKVNFDTKANVFPPLNSIILIKIGPDLIERNLKFFLIFTPCFVQWKIWDSYKNICVHDSILKHYWFIYFSFARKLHHEQRDLFQNQAFNQVMITIMVSRPFLSQPNVTMNSCLYTISVPTILCTFYCLYKTFHPVADCKPWTVTKPIMTHLLSCPYVFYPFYVLYGNRHDRNELKLMIDIRL
jgi:hypothetical protein